MEFLGYHITFQLKKKCLVTYYFFVGINEDYFHLITKDKYVESGTSYWKKLKNFLALILIHDITKNKITFFRYCTK